MRKPNPPSTNLETLRRIQDNVIAMPDPEEVSDSRLIAMAQQMWHSREDLEVVFIAQELIRRRRLTDPTMTFTRADDDAHMDAQEPR